MTLVGYDSDTTADLPQGADFYFGYVNGYAPNFRAVKARFPDKPVLSIAVNDSADADCLDIENGDATPKQAPGWVRRQIRLGRQRPVVYASQSLMPQVLKALVDGGLLRGQVRVWTAHYGHEHICSPGACKAVGFAADATQWAASPGESPGHYDITLATDTFLAQPAPQPVPEDEGMQPIIIQAKGGASQAVTSDWVFKRTFHNPAEAHALTAQLKDKAVHVIDPVLYNSLIEAK